MQNIKHSSQGKLIAADKGSVNIITATRAACYLRSFFSSTFLLVVIAALLLINTAVPSFCDISLFKLFVIVSVVIIISNSVTRLLLNTSLKLFDFSFNNTSAAIKIGTGISKVSYSKTALLNRLYQSNRGKYIFWDFGSGNPV